MRIHNIVIKNLLAFESADIAVGPGLSIIIAPNEGGKSSLMRAMIIGLYQDASSRKRELLALRHWGSGSYPRVELRVEIGGEEVRIVRDFDEHKQYLYRGDETDHFKSGRDVDRYLRDALVVYDEQLFVRVCGVGQEELARVADGRADIGDRLEEILSGGWGSVSPTQVQGEIEDVRAELRRGLDRPANRENWGPLKRYTEEVKTLEAALEEAQSTDVRRETLLRTLSEAHRERERIGLELLREQHGRAREYAEVRRTVEETEGRMRTLQQRRERMEELLAERERLRERGNGYPPFLPACDGPALERIQRNLEREDILRRQVEVWAGKPPARPIRAWLIAGAVLVACGIAGWALWGVAFAAVAALGILFGAWGLARRRRGDGAGASTEYREELDRLGRGRKEWAVDRPLDASRELLREFLAWRHELYESDVRLQETVRGSDGAHRPADGHAGSVPAGPPEDRENAASVLEELNDQFMRLSAEWHAFRGKLASLEPFHLDAPDLLSLEKKIERAQVQARDLDERIASLERELAALPQGDANLVRERLSTALEALGRVGRKSAIIDCIIETLDEARGTVAGLLADRLPPVAGRYISTITGGRYETVFVDPVTVRVEVAPAMDAIPAGGDPGAIPERVSPAALSQGTRDQIYFAVRLAIVELLGGRETLPVLLDDPFVHFDEERRERALDLLREFSRRHQVLLFSCDPRYERPGETVIRL